MEDRKSWLALSLAPGLGPAGFWSLVRRFGSPAAVLAASAAELSPAAGIRAGVGEALRRPAVLLAAAETELEKLARLGGRLLIGSDDDYPVLLRHGANPPPVLFVHGRRPELLNNTAVAMVGSRAATSYGRRVAFRLARDLAGRRITVVSGLAMGIDAEAHAGGLEGAGSTVAVLGCGLDVVYPRSNQRLYTRLVENGLLVTEYPLGTRPEGFRFPARNRIIAGMSLGVVVVEAARRSGSLITVQHALDEGREVFAVPGQIDSVKSSGTHWLLQQGASLIVSAEDIARQLRLEPAAGGDTASGDASDPVLEGASAALLALLDSYPKSRNELLNRSGLTAGRLSEILLLLELDGLVELLPGDEIRKIEEPCPAGGSRKA